MAQKKPSGFSPKLEDLAKVLDIAGHGQGGIFQWLVEELNDGLLIIDENVRLVYVNKSVAAILRAPRQELVGKNLLDFFDESSRQVLIEGFERRRRGEKETYEQRWNLYDGRFLDTIISARPLLDLDGNFRGSFVVVRDITERVKAETALAESEERMRTLINAIPDIVCFRDGEGRWIEASNSDLQLFRLENVDYRGKTHMQLCEDSPEFERIFRECIITDEAAWEKGSPLRYEELIKMPDGSLVTHDTIKMPLFHDDGSRKALVVIGRDITERKSMERALFENESRYRSLFEDSPISLWVEDLSIVKDYFNELESSGVTDFREYFETTPEAVIRCIEGVRILDVNRSTLELLAAETKPQLLASLSNVVPPEEFPKIRDEFIALAEGATFYRGEIGHIALDGTHKQLVVQFNVMPGHEDTLDRVLVSLQDITDVKHAQDETQKSKALLEKTFAGLREAVLIVDTDSGLIVDVNPAASRILGYTRQEILGRKPDFLFAAKDQEHADLQNYADELARFSSSAVPQITLVRKDGELILAEFDVSTPRDESGRRIAWVVVIRDITEDSKVREQLERVQKVEALSALAGGIAHEINQPLNALRLYSTSLEMLLESDKDIPQDTIISRLKFILAETDKIKDIITHMRSLVHQEGGDPEPDADLNESVRRAISLIGSQIKSHGIRLDMSLSGGLPNVRANSLQLEQVTINLSVNAMQALDETGREDKRIEIATSLNGDHVILTVTDNGPGLTANPEDIFKPFFTTKAGGPASGMGLGLSIVDTFVRSWGGRISAQTIPGGGTRFRILLPVSNFD